MMVWITKYWDSRGICEAKVEPCAEVPNAVWDGHPGGVRFRYNAGDWYESLDDAYEHVMRLRAARIASMENELRLLPARIARAKKKPVTVRFVLGRTEKREPHARGGV